jgi:Holliday junction resolvase RusA-like endonuclease
VGQAVLTYDDTPPSINSPKSGYKGHWSQGHDTKSRWEGIFAMLLLKEKVPRDVGRVTVRAELRFPTNQKRDPDNFRVVLSKALGDALQKVGVLKDDSEEFYDLTSLRINPEGEKGPARTLVEITWPEKDEGPAGVAAPSAGPQR